MRLFVAVFPPAHACAHLHRHLTAPVGRTPETPGPAALPRLTPVARWHVTLVFLGEVPADQLGAVVQALDAVPRTGAVAARLAGGGRFGRGRSAAVWAGVEGDVAALHDKVRSALANGGLSIDPRPFVGHLTVTRSGDETVLERLRGYRGPAWQVDEFALVRSGHPVGGGYEQLAVRPCG